jgi:hypothetical protein
MTYDEQLQSISRSVARRVVLYLDYCANTCGVSPCAAAGSPFCYYTFPTCQDPAHFTKTSKAYAFSLNDGPSVPESLPYLVSVKEVPTELRPGDNVTRRARITLEFLDDAPLALANPDKSVSNAETAGGYLRNLIARNPNAAGRIAEIWQGFEGLELSDYRLTFRGVIEKMEWKNGRATVVVKDQLALLDKKIPSKQSSGNALTALYNGGATMYVADESEFVSPGTVKVEDEYVTFTGTTAGALTGCGAGAFGTTPVAHAAGKAVRQVAAFADAEDGEGLPPDEIFLALLCTHGGIDPLAIAVVDRGAILGAGITGGSTQIPVNITEAFPETGIARIDDELIRFRGISGGALLVAERGAYGTQADAHDAGAAVKASGFTDELGRWMAGTRFRRMVEQATAVKDLVNDLREQCLVHVWQAENSTIRAKCVAPPFYTDAPKELDDESGFIAGSTSWEAGDELRATRITVHYDPVTPEAGKDADAYAGLLVLMDAEAESPEFYGEAGNVEVWGNWIYRELEALLLASRYLIRYRSGAAAFKFAVELKDEELEVGDFVRIKSADVIDASGEPRGRALFEVTRKQRVSDNRIEFLAIDTRLDRRYPVIAPAGLIADYDEAEEQDQERYGWAGNSQNRVGNAGEDGYYIY